MRRGFTGLRISFLAFFADDPACPKQSRVRVRRAFENGDAAADLAYAFAQQRLDRRAFFDPRRKMVRIAGETNRRLASYQQFDKLRMALVKFDAVGRDLFEQFDRLFIALVFSLGKSHQKLKITRLGDQLSLPFRIGEILELLGLIAFLDETCIPAGDEKLHVGRDPLGSFEHCGMSGSLGNRERRQKLLLGHLREIARRAAEHISYDPAAALLRDDTRNQLI